MTIKTFDTCVAPVFNNAHDDINKCLADGYVVLNVSIYTYDSEITERWTLHKPDNQQTVDANNLQVRAITQIERKETYSKTARKNFSFWACTLENGEKVNVFDHPDESRNTWKIAESKGWGDWEVLGEGVTETYYPPVPCVLSYDGQWYSLVNIMEEHQWRFAYDNPADYKDHS